MLRIAVMSTKGGVGKTTIAANLAAILADIGFRVLMIDADVQPSLTKYYPLKHRAPEGLSHVLRKQRVSADSISHTIYPGLDLIASDDEDGMLQPWLATKVGSHDYLTNALESPLLNDLAYDFCVMDTQGAQGALQNNAGLAASQILLPIVAESIAAREFVGGTMNLISTLEPTPQFRNRIGPIRAVLNRVDRSSDSKTVTTELREHFIKLQGRVSLLQTQIPRSVAYQEASTARIPVHMHERERHGGTMLAAWDVMHAIAWELIPSLKDIVGTGFALHGTDDTSAALVDVAKSEVPS